MRERDRGGRGKAKNNILSQQERRKNDRRKKEIQREREGKRPCSTQGVWKGQESVVCSSRRGNSQFSEPALSIDTKGTRKVCATAAARA